MHILRQSRPLNTFILQDLLMPINAIKIVTTIEKHENN
jgi:hypothetical protein